MLRQSIYNPVRPECHRCPLYTRQKDCVVPPEGSLGALVALVGEGPGSVEERYHRPFIGPAGQMLKWLLKQAGAPPREHMFITNAAMCKPRPIQTYDEHGNESLYLPYKKVLERSTQDTCRARLHSELALVRPRVVLAVGNYALESLTGQRNILKRHGAIIPATVRGVDLRTAPVEHQTIVVPLLHPAALLRKPNETYGVIEVLKRVQRIAGTGNVTANRSYGERHYISPYHQAGPDGALDILEEAVDRVIRERQEIAVDVETTTELPRTATLTIFGFATYQEAFVVTILAWNVHEQRFEACWTPAQAERRDAIIRRLLNAGLDKWAWNYSFDKTVCARVYGTDDNWHDGLHWHWTIQPELDHHLNFAVQMWLDAPPWKADFWAKQNAGLADHRDLEAYNGDDCRYTIHLVPYLRQKAAERDVQGLVDHQMRVSELARRAELYGIPVYRKAALELREKHAARMEELLQQMRDAVRGHEQSFRDSVYRQRYRDAKDRARKSGNFNQPDYQHLTADDFNPNSPHHGRWFLYEFLKLKTGRWTGGGAEKDETAKRLSTSYKGILNYLADPKVGKLVRAYVDHSEEDYRVKHLIDPVLRKAEEDPDHPDWVRLFVSWNTCGMKGTRWTSKLVNMQNWTKEMRKLLRAKPGRVWVGADAAQIEYRIAACLAGLEELIKLFNQEEFDEELEPWKKFDGKYDAHSLVGEEVYGDQYRSQAKEFAQCMQWLLRALPGKQPPEILRWKLGEVPEHVRVVWKRAKAAKKLLDNWRTMVKRVVYALFYGARPAKILVTIQEDRRVPIELRAALTEERITKIWDGFKRRFPEWDRWAYREMDLAVSRGYQVFPPLNRKRYWTQKEVEENKIRNTPIQLAAGDVCNIIFCNVQDRIDAEGLDSLMTIHGHDAGYFDTLEAHAERVRDIYNEEFHLDLPGPAGNVHIFGQAAIGPTVADVG